MGKKISLADFITGYDKAENIDEYVNEHIVNEYIPLERNTAICDAIIESSSYVTVGEGENVKRIFKLNSPARYMHFHLQIVNLYTDIDIAAEYKNETTLEAFNELKRRDIFDRLLLRINSREIKELKDLLDSMLDDMIQNERDIVSYIDNKLRAFSYLGEELTNKINALLQTGQIK